MMKNLLINLGLISLILAGVTICSFPWLEQRWKENQLEQLTIQWEQGNHKTIEPDINQSTILVPSSSSSSKEDGETEKQDIIGMLDIPTIEFHQPILKGTNKTNLAISVTTVEPTVLPGEYGNLTIAGHNSWSYGRNFNRLNEVSKGDRLLLDDGEEIYFYVVTEIEIVEPKDVWILNSDPKKQEITLITCWPMKEPTHRLIVKGYLESVESKQLSR